jgi:hypothetical protein
MPESSDRLLMRSLSFLILVLVFSCAQQPVRKLAFQVQTYLYGDVDLGRSSVKQFPNQTFFLELKDQKGDPVDCDKTQIIVMGKKSKIIPFELIRAKLGTYYVQVKEETLQTINFVIQGKAWSGKYDLAHGIVSALRSELKFISKVDHTLTLQLTLKDLRGDIIDIPTVPEVLLDSQLELDKLTYIGRGIWEIRVTLPEQNHVSYISIRAHGTDLGQSYRIQHVEL